MKKVLFLVAIMVASVSASFAQESPYTKGDFSLGGSLGYTDVKDSYSSFTINATGLYWLNTKFSVGAELGYSETDLEIGGSTDVFTFGVAGMYLKPLSEVFSFYAKASVGVESADDTSVYVYVEPGIQANLGKNFALNVSAGNLGYYGGTDTFNFGIGTGFTCGLQYTF